MKNTTIVAILLLLVTVSCFGQSDGKTSKRKTLNIEFHLFLSGQFMYKNVNNYLEQNDFARVTPEQIGIQGGYNYNILPKLNIGITSGLSTNFGMLGMTTKSLLGNINVRYKMTEPRVIPYLSVGVIANTIWSRSEKSQAVNSPNSISLQNNFVTLTLGAMSSKDDAKYQRGLEFFASFGKNPWLTNDTERLSINVMDRLFGIKLFVRRNRALF